MDAVESEIIQLLPAQTKTNFSRLKRRCKQILEIKREINPGCGLLCFYVTPSDIEDIKEQKLIEWIKTINNDQDLCAILS